MVAARNVARLVDGPESLRKKAVVEVELVVDNRPLVGIDVGDLVQRDRKSAVAAILRHEFLRRRDEAVPVLRRRETISCPLVGSGKLGQAESRPAGGKIRDRII